MRVRRAPRSGRLGRHDSAHAPDARARPRAALFVLGDAAGYVEPFTGEGMAWAFAAAEAVVPLAIRAIERLGRRHGRRVDRRPTRAASAASSAGAAPWPACCACPALVAPLVALLQRQPGLAQPAAGASSPARIRTLRWAHALLRLRHRNRVAAPRHLPGARRRDGAAVRLHQRRAAAAAQGALPDDAREEAPQRRARRAAATPASARQSFFPPMQDANDRGPTTAERMARYERDAPALGAEAARAALADAGRRPGRRHAHRVGVVHGVRRAQLRSRPGARPRPAAHRRAHARRVHGLPRRAQRPARRPRVCRQPARRLRARVRGGAVQPALPVRLDRRLARVERDLRGRRGGARGRRRAARVRRTRGSWREAARRCSRTRPS